MPDTNPSALIVCSFAAMLAGSLAGCIGDDEKPDDTSGGGVACTEIAIASVTIDVVDQTGAPLSPTTITYSLDGADAVAAECIDEGCTSFVTDWEVPGEFTIVATWHEDTADPCCWYDDYVTQTVTVGMTEDGCHVVPEAITLTLDTSLLACADGDECG